MIARLVPLLALATLLLLVAGSGAQPPQPIVVPDGPPAAAAPTLPVVPKSAAAFVTIKLAVLAAHPDMKPVLAQLAKQPDALAGFTEAVGVSPLEIDRVTLFWPRLNAGGRNDPALVISTREPFNEARVLKNLKADPVFDDGRGGRGGRYNSQRWNAEQAKPGVKFAPGGHGSGAVDKERAPVPKTPGVPPEVDEPKLPKAPSPQPLEKQEDLCSPFDSSDVADPLYYALARGPFSSLFLIDDRTLVFLPDRSDGGFTQLALLAANLKKNASGPLADAIGAAGKHTFAAGVYLPPLLRELDRNVPRELVPYTALFASRTAVCVGDLDKSAKFTLTLNFDNATAAKRAAPVLEEGAAIVAEKVEEWVTETKDSRDPFEKSVAPIVATFVTGLKKAAVKVDGATVVANAEVDAGPAAAKALGELLVAVQSRKKAEARMTNLKQIGLALHAYHDVNNKFPTNVYGPNGERLLSWRVQLLPYLEEEGLYKQFKLDEAWDGPNNKALSEKLPKVFQAPDREHSKGKTFYQGFSGAKDAGIRPWLQHGDKNGIGFNAITDGSSNTIAVIEARDGVVWSKPDDLLFGGAVPLLGEKGWDRTPALLLDGSVALFPTDMKAEAFWPFVTINGGEVTDHPEDSPPRKPFDRRPVAQPPVVGRAPVKEPAPRNAP